MIYIATRFCIYGRCTVPHHKALRYGIPYTLLPYALLLQHERIFAPNERIAPFPNFPQPMFERPTPSCKHTHKSTSLLEAPPADARQNRRKDRIHAKASPNIRCPKTRPQLDGLCKPEENKGSIRPEEQNVQPLLSEFRSDIPPVSPRSSSEIRSVRKTYRLSRGCNSSTADMLNLSIQELAPPAGSGLSVRLFSTRSRREPGRRKPTKRLSLPLPSPRRSVYREPSRHRPPHKRRECPSGNSRR